MILYLICLAGQFVYQEVR